MRDARETITAAVCEAAEWLGQHHFAGVTPPVILLGGAGYIGKPIAAALRAKGIDVHIVDPRGVGHPLMPAILRGRESLLIDVSRRGVIGTYIDQMWPELVVLNETFPRPAAAHIRTMTERGVEVFHLSGLAGSITPPLPFGYEDAVPCCAAHGIGDKPEVRIVKIGTGSADGGARAGTRSAA